MPVPRVFTCLFLSAGLGLALHAENLAAYRTGDRADADIVTPVALDLIDPTATATLRSTKALQVPVVFRSFPEATNFMAGEFLAVFTQTRSHFLAEAAASSSAPAGTNAATAPPDPGKLIAVFNAKNPGFPVTDELAAEWTRGGDGAMSRDKLLQMLQQAENKLVRPNDLPDGFAPGENIRLVPVSDLNQRLSLDEVQHGRVVPASGLVTVAAARKLLREEFTTAEQPLARALAGFLEPNCFPDAPFTQLVRGAAVDQLVVSDHFDAGQVIVHRGEVIDAKTKAALEALNEKLLSSPPAPVAAVAAVPQSATAPKIVALKPAPMTDPPPMVLKDGRRGLWMIAILTGISLAASLVAWQQSKRQKKPQLLPAPPATLALAAGQMDEPQMAQRLREAVMRELALQRRELLQAQQTAADEIAALIHRLDQLQLPIQERERAYEARIQALEKELAARAEENRELLTLKLEIVRRQLETERVAHNAGRG